MQRAQITNIFEMHVSHQRVDFIKEAVTHQVEWHS